jgi:hypothetical protein
MDNLVNENELVIEIYFKRKNSNCKILIEKWSTSVFDKGKPRDMLNYMTMLRSVYSYSRLLPAFTFFKNTGFDYTLSYTTYFNDDLRTNTDYFNKKRHFLKFSNILIEYLNKGDIFKTEEEMVI